MNILVCFGRFTQLLLIFRSIYPIYPINLQGQEHPLPAPRLRQGCLWHGCCYRYQQRPLRPQRSPSDPHQGQLRHRQPLSSLTACGDIDGPDLLCF